MTYAGFYSRSLPGKCAGRARQLSAVDAHRSSLGFRHWIYSGNAYLDDYREFGTGDLTWEPDERMNFSYDALNRLIATAPDSGASGYRHTYAYTADGNILSRTDVGSYAYPPAGQARAARGHRGRRQQLRLRPQRQHDERAPRRA